MKTNFDLGQHFLVDKDVISDLIASAHVGKSSAFSEHDHKSQSDLRHVVKRDNVIEIGAGIGNITKELAKQANQVLAFEIDKRFKPMLSKLPRNVIVKYADAFWFFRKLTHMCKYKRFETEKLGQLVINGVKYNKIVAAMPYALCEPMMHQLLFAYDYEVAVWIVSTSYARHLQVNPLPKAMLHVKFGRRIAKSAFNPQPDTESRIVIIKPRKEFNLPEESGLYVMRCVYLLEAMKLKNALRESVIKLYSKLGKVLTKKQARELVASFGFSDRLLETRAHDIDSSVYFDIEKKIRNL